MDSLRRQILARLRRGPADERALAGWCDVHVRIIRRVLAQMHTEAAIRVIGERYALPFNPLSPAGPVIIPQFRWGATRLV